MVEIIDFKNRRRKKKLGDKSAKRGSPAERKIDVKKCPIEPLGHCQGVYFYLCGSGERRQLICNEHDALGIAGLFGGNVEWLAENFGRFDCDGQRTRHWSDFDAACWLFRQCANRGLCDPPTILRDPGV